MTVTKDHAVAAGMRHTVFHNTALGPCSDTHKEAWWSNGRCKTWVSRPGDWQLPIACGMRGRGYITESNADMYHREEDCPMLNGGHEGTTLQNLIDGDASRHDDDGLIG